MVVREGRNGAVFKTQGQYHHRLLFNLWLMKILKHSVMNIRMPAGSPQMNPSPRYAIGVIEGTTMPQYTCSDISERLVKPF